MTILGQSCHEKSKIMIVLESQISHRCKSLYLDIRYISQDGSAHERKLSAHSTSSITIVAFVYIFTKSLRLLKKATANVRL